MTNETNTRTKANAVFFAAIMVVSMVAVGFAAAPAAAATTDLTVDGPVQSGNDASGTVNYNNSTVDIYIVLDEDGDGTYDDGVRPTSRKLLLLLMDPRPGVVCPLMGLTKVITPSMHTRMPP